MYLNPSIVPSNLYGNHSALCCMSRLDVETTICRYFGSPLVPYWKQLYEDSLEKMIVKNIYSEIKEVRHSQPVICFDQLLFPMSASISTKIYTSRVCIALLLVI